MFGWHWDKANIGRANCYAKGWRYKQCPTADDIVPIVTEYTNTPCAWSHGIRNQKNFKGALWVGIDIDDGWPLEKALSFFEPWVHVIGTTRSHRKQKGDKPPCDRYRVFLKLQEFCSCGESYKLTLGKIADYMGADKACVDTARIFRPVDLVRAQHIGRTVKIVRPQGELIQQRERRIAQVAQNHHRRVLPWIRDILEHGVSENRNDAVFRVSLWLARCGWSETEIFELVWNSKIPIAQDRKRHHEIAKTVRSACRAASSR